MKDWKASTKLPQHQGNMSLVSSESLMQSTTAGIIITTNFYGLVI